MFNLPIAQVTDVAAAGIDLTTLQLAFAAGIGLWVIPISILALMTVARKGANASGSVL